MASANHVDIWWAKADSLAEASDAPIHCRAIGLGAGLPAGWRRGARRRFVQGVLSHYENRPQSGGSRTWRLNGGAAGLHLSLSDSREYLAAAIGRGIPVGVDMEKIRPIDDPLATLRRLGLEILADRLMALAPSARNRAFLMLWTAFEAFLKLERLRWDEGAARFAALARHWRLGGDGTASFIAAARAGVAFRHLWPGQELVVAVATPLACLAETRAWPVRGAN
jgi:hypothetical protein